MRSNPEDFLVLIGLFNKNNSLATSVDLRDEIRSLPIISAAAEPTSSASSNDKISSIAEVQGVLKSAFINFKATDSTHTISLSEYKCSWTSDGQNLYYASSDSKLTKFGIPKLPNETLYVKESVEFTPAEKTSICYLQGRILVRNPGELETPLRIINSETLKEDKEATEAIKIAKDDE